MLTESATQALSILRDASLFQWYVIPIFALVVYVYSVEIERRNWNLVFAGLAFWGMDWINEI
jgi:RsiW-degrading membrane proteinase PrsW (M82 family)